MDWGLGFQRALRERERERERESLENKNSKDYVGVFESFLNSLAVF
jgi:hypothetical protein